MATSFEALPFEQQLEARQAAEVFAGLQRLLDLGFPDIRRAAPPGTSLEEFSRRFFKQKQKAIGLFAQALTETIEYSKALEGGSLKNSQKEKKLASLWKNAGEAVVPIDPSLASSLLMKGLGWIDPKVWERAEERGIKIRIPDMEMALEKLVASKEPDMPKPVPSWFPIAGVCFAAAGVLFLMYLYAMGPSPDPAKQTIFNVLVAFCLAAGGAFLGGDAIAKGKIPWFQDSPISFRAAGGIGIFVIAYLILHFTM
jgi:hypothetical protein